MANSKAKTPKKRLAGGQPLAIEKPPSWDLPSLKSDSCDLLLRGALIKLGIDEQELQRTPRLTEICREAHGGLDAVIRAMRLSFDPSVEAFLREYDAAHPQDREIVPWEAFAMLARVDIRQLLGAIILALREQSVQMVKVIAITSHPATMRARVQSAMWPGPDGVRDRNALDQALKFLPTSKGTTFITMPGGTVINTDHEQDAETEVDPEDLFPDLAVTQKLIGG